MRKKSSEKIVSTRVLHRGRSKRRPRLAPLGSRLARRDVGALQAIGTLPSRSLDFLSEGVSSRLGRSMTEVNKLIFVQDFERASRVLGVLSKQYPADYEVQFRRIEVACRTDEIGSVCDDLRSRALQLPQVLALQFAATLAEIRVLEKMANDSREADELINPSLSLPRGRGDVTGLSADAERGSLLSSPRSGLSSLTSQAIRPLSLAQQTLRVVRNPLVADDLAVMDPPQAPDSYADLEAGAHPEVEDERMQIPCIRQAFASLKQFPDNYAAWFVAGCAYEYLGELAQAIESWGKAISLEPNAMSALATMAELQQIGAIPADDADYADRFEALDKYLVHGTFETHSALYKEFLERKEYSLAIAALRTLGDWIQRQRGEVPHEIEILCLLGAMKAYALEGNIPSSEACRREAENLAVSCKKQPKSGSQIAFIGQIAEEYGLMSLARMCYFSVLVFAESPTDLVVRTAAHCVSSHTTPALKECLKSAYIIHQGHAEIRFCMLLCDLTLAGATIKAYMERKALIRTAISQNEVGTALKLMTESLKDTEEDPEIQYYLGEVLSKLGAVDQASKHFESMYSLDCLNVDSALRFLQFLVRQARHEAIEALVDKIREDFPNLNSAQNGEVCWAAASALFAGEKVFEARAEVEKAMRGEPWSPSFMALALRLHEPTESQAQLPQGLAHGELVRRLESKVAISAGELDEGLIKRLLERGRMALTLGFNEYAYMLARSVFLLNSKHDEVLEFFSRAGAGINSRQATQHTLLLLQSKHSNGLTFGYLAMCIARIYCHSGEWALVDEWIDIALKSGVDDKFTRSKLFELEALKITLSGTNLRKAQNLLEAAIDIYENGQKIPAEAGVLHGYLLVVQGDIKAGVEKMQTHIGETSSIQSLYFLVKGLERAGRLQGVETENIARMFKLAPTNTLEQRLIEEIYCTVGLHKSGAAVNLAC